MRFNKLLIVPTSILIGAALFALAPICGSPDEEIQTPTPETPVSSPIPTQETTPIPPPPFETSTPSTSTFGYEEPAVLPTPASPTDAMFLGGELWVDGGTLTGEVIAYIDGLECGRGQSISPDGSPVFAIRIASATEQPGCGTPGAPITLTMNGRAMNDTVAWQPGSQQPLALFAGPVVARYLGSIQFDAPFDQTDIWPQRVVPYIDGIVCGSQQNPMQGNGHVGYEVAVMPDELRPGCGREGASITLRLEVTAAGEPVTLNLHDVPWQPGPRVELATIEIASSTILQPATPADAARQ